MIKKKQITDIFLFAATLIIIIYFIINATASFGYNWQWYRIPNYLLKITDDGISPGILFEGLWVTIKISFFSMIVCLISGVITAILKTGNSYVGRLISGFYVETIRNTPLLIQIFVIYFVIAPVFNMTQFMSAILSLGLFEGAYVAEIIRGGIQSVNQSQWEASYSLGMNKFKTYRYVILPQAIKNSLPTLISQMISLIKDSSLVSTIAVYELTMKGQTVISETFLTFEVWFTVAIIYLTITVFLQLIAKIINLKLSNS